MRGVQSDFRMIKDVNISHYKFLKRNYEFLWAKIDELGINEEILNIFSFINFHFTFLTGKYIFVRNLENVMETLTWALTIVINFNIHVLHM